MQPNELIWSGLPYGKQDLKFDAASRYVAKHPSNLLRGERLECCIEGCAQSLARRKRGATRNIDLFCSEHGISVSTSPTYVYLDHIRNFTIGRDFVGKMHKVERWRLGNENSEDAVSWNVFVGLYAIGGLRLVFERLTGIQTGSEPELYLWGNHINGNEQPWGELLRVREKLENGFSIPTEPDVMLRVPGLAVVLIEAKLGAANGTLAKQKRRFGSVGTWLKRYCCKPGEPDPLDRQWISGQTENQVLEQLGRNVIFAHWLACEGEKPIVVNLVRRAAVEKEPTCDENHFRKHLSPDCVEFLQRTWEDIYELPAIKGQEESVLAKYFRGKTLNLAPAFET